MPHKRCFISNCFSNSGQENSAVHTFGVPRGKLEEWQGILKHKTGLTKNSRFCPRHFNEEDIVKGLEILGVFHANKKWHLKDGVKPTLYLGCLHI